jgi:uncharacterized membrane protein
MLTNLLQVSEPIIHNGTSEAVTEIALSEVPESKFVLSEIFMAGGWYFMAIITLVLVCALFAAWKAPAWVKSLGRVAIAVGIFAFLSGVQDIAKICLETGNQFPFSVYCGGFRVALIAPLYSIIVYVVITIVDMVRRPRI